MNNQGCKIFFRNDGEGWDGGIGGWGGWGGATLTLQCKYFTLGL